MCLPNQYYYKHRCYDRTPIDPNATNCGNKCTGDEMCTIGGCVNTQTFWLSFMGIVLGVIFVIGAGQFVAYRIRRQAVLQELRRQEAEHNAARAQVPSRPAPPVPSKDITVL